MNCLKLLPLPLLVILLFASTPCSCAANTYSHIAAVKKQIQANWYPVFTMQRQSQSTITFKLLENGYISDLKLLHSSGASLADQAAMSAVAKSVPFAVGGEEIHCKAIFGSGASVTDHSGIVSGRNQLKLMVLVPSQLEEARVLYLSKKWSRARDAFETVLMFEPNNPEAIYKKAVCDLYYYGDSKWANIRRTKYEAARHSLSKAREMFAEIGEPETALKISKWIDEVDNKLASVSYRRVRPGQILN